MLNEKVIVRGDRSGVFCGMLESQNGQEVVLTNCRRLWSWSGACSDFELATHGVSNPEDCRFTVRVEKIKILDAIEVLKMTEKAIESIEGVSEWKKAR